MAGNGSVYDGLPADKCPRSLGTFVGLVAPLRRGALCLLAFTGYLFFYNNLPLLDLLFRSMTVAVRCHIPAGIVFTLCSLPELTGVFPKRLRKGLLEADLILVLVLSGAMIYCRDRFVFEIKYGLAVVHASSALFFLSLRVARWYDTVMRRKPQRGKKWHGHVTFEPIDR